MEKDKTLGSKHWLTIVLFIFIGFIVIGYFLGEVRETFSETPKEVYVNVTYDELKPIFSANSDNTDLQKEETFNRNYKGKYVIWEGRVRDLDKIDENNFELDVTLKEGPWFDIAGVTDEYVTVYLDRSQYSKAIALKEGDNITFSGKFDKYSTTLGLIFYFEDGEILS